jgi:transposase-like protein
LSHNRPFEAIGWFRALLRCREHPVTKRHFQSAPPSVVTSAFAGFRFPAEVITVAVRWYLRFALSYRDVEELLGEPGVDVDHVIVYRWVQRFTPLLAEPLVPPATPSATAGTSTRPT